MIVLDTSALVAIVFAEPERDLFVDAIEQADNVLVSSVSVVETRMVVSGRRGQRARRFGAALTVMATNAITDDETVRPEPARRTILASGAGRLPWRCAERRQ